MGLYMFDIRPRGKENKKKLERHIIANEKSLAGLGSKKRTLSGRGLQKDKIYEGSFISSPTFKVELAKKGEKTIGAHHCFTVAASGAEKSEESHDDKTSSETDSKMDKG